MALNYKLNEKMLQKYKQSSLNVIQRQLKMIVGDITIDETTLKGNISKYIEIIKDKKLKNDKVYYNALFQVYTRSDYSESELNELKEQLTKANNQCDLERKEMKNKKQSSDAKANFTISWHDLKTKYYELQNIYKQKPNLNNAVRWLVCALYSDEHFGAKRYVDITNLKWENIHEIDNNKVIKFQCQKNEKYYTSSPIRDYINKPLCAVKNYTKSQRVLVNKKGLRFSQQQFHSLVNDLFGVNTMTLRKLWASYKYKTLSIPSEIINHAYELNHTTEVHLRDYIQNYHFDDDRIVKIKDYKFKKVISYVSV